MHETKVNLKHLLEDIRDSYTISLEEIIVVELIANALDSGASRLDFFVNKNNRQFAIMDNGQGMRRPLIPQYHNIAATTKIRGRGIGFAGIGAKLSLLISDSVITETKGGYGSRCATQWYLKNETTAPWKYIPFSGRVPYSRGTAVALALPQDNLPLLTPDFLAKTIYHHYYPLFHWPLFNAILKHIYKKGVEFFINQKRITAPAIKSFKPEVFQIRLGGRSRKLVGMGYLAKTEVPAKLLFPGLGISTYGKVIKSGWEWIGLGPRQDWQIYGLVEVPALAEILTTNKMDFLKDTNSLRKYYRFRKVIQEAVLPVLANFGEQVFSSSQKQEFRSLTNQIEIALRSVLGSFPELVPLLGIRHLRKTGLSFSSPDEPLVGIIDKNDLTVEIPKPKEKKSTKESLMKKKKPKKKGPRLSIGFEEREQNSALARMVEDKIWINTAHPAYLKAQNQGYEKYHILFCVGWSLSSFLEDNRSPQAFIDAFLASWGQDQKSPPRLWKI